MRNPLRLSDHGMNSQRLAQERGFALIPLLVLLTLLTSITTILTMETVSATRLTEAGRRSRRLDIARRAAAVTEMPDPQNRSLSMSPSTPGYQMIRFHRDSLPLSGIPLSRYLDASLPCSTAATDTISTHVCGAIPLNSGLFTSLSGGLSASTIVVPETIRFIYVRGNVRIDNLTITGPSLTMSALGSITIGSVSSLRRPPPTLLLLSRTDDYRTPATSPGNTAIVTGSSPLAASLIDTTVFPQPQGTIIGMRFPGG